MKIKQALLTGRNQLEKRHIDKYSLEAELILAFVLKKKREFLFTHPESKLKLWQILKYKKLIRQRLKNTPLAYLTGNKEFYGFDFKVNKNVLIPRPETELIIDEVVSLNQKIHFKNFIDIGTGSGCIIITLLKKIKNGNFIAADISTKALKITSANISRHDPDKKIKIIKSDLLKNIDFKTISGPTIITANLPYLSPEQIKNSPSIQKEPLLALASGPDGLDHYRRLFKEIKDAKQKLGQLFIFCEIDETQTETISQLINQELPEANFQIKKDLNGLDRLVILSLEK